MAVRRSASQTLAAFIEAHPDREAAPGAEGFPAFVDGTEEVVVIAVLDLTAVVHPPGRDDPHSRRVVRLTRLVVCPDEVTTRPRDPQAPYGRLREQANIGRRAAELNRRLWKRRMDG